MMESTFQERLAVTLTLTINGTTMVDADFPKMPAEGVIGFQLHSGGATEAIFRKIEFKEMR